MLLLLFCALSPALCSLLNAFVLYVSTQGFASGSLDKDAAAPRMFVDMGLEILVSQSYSKNLGLVSVFFLFVDEQVSLSSGLKFALCQARDISNLKHQTNQHTLSILSISFKSQYGERVGACVVVSSDAESAKRVLSQMKKIARAIWSNPPMHGAKIAAEVCALHELPSIYVIICCYARAVSNEEECLCHTGGLPRALTALRCCIYTRAHTHTLAHVHTQSTGSQ